MKTKRLCVSRLMQVMLGVVGTSMPLLSAVAADQVAIPSAVADEEASGKVSAGSVEAATQTKVVVSR